MKLKLTLFAIAIATVSAVVTSCGYAILATDEAGNVIITPKPIVVPAK